MNELIWRVYNYQVLYHFGCNKPVLLTSRCDELIDGYCFIQAGWMGIAFCPLVKWNKN